MSKYKVICGSAGECERKLNEYIKTHWIIIHGVSVDKDLTTIVVELNERT